MSRLVDKITSSVMHFKSRYIEESNVKRLVYIRLNQTLSRLLDIL